MLLDEPKLVPFWAFSSQRIQVSCALTLECRHHCVALLEQAVEFHNGHVNRHNSHRRLMERKVAQAQPKDPDLRNRETDCGSSGNHTATTTRPIVPSPARFRQPGHRGTDCFSCRHLCTVKDTSKTSSKMFSKEFMRVPRSEPNVHDVDGA